jgi:hypothetical protein
MQRIVSILPILLLILISCNEAEKPAQNENENDQPNPAATRDTAAAPSRPLVLKDQLTPSEVFAEIVYNEYARRGTAIPKTTMDSLFKLYSNNLPKMETEMNAYMKKVDDRARKQIAENHKIPVDSVSAIIAKKEKEREAEQ